MVCVVFVVEEIGELGAELVGLVAGLHLWLGLWVIIHSERISIS